MLRIARIVLGVAIVLNWALFALIALGLFMSLRFQPVLVPKFETGHPPGTGMIVIEVLRLCLVLGAAAVVPAHVIFTRLRAIVSSAEGGDPFIAENSRRLSAIAWALLALQLLDLIYGAITIWLRVRADFFVGWSFSVGGWIAVLMVFVLARVFRTGARMRDDLEMTV